MGRRVFPRQSDAMTAKLLQPARSRTRRARAALRALLASQPEVHVVAVIVVRHNGDRDLTVALDSYAPISKESTMLPPNVIELRRGSAHTARCPAPVPERGTGLRLVRPMAPTLPTA
jgi:hypothetical protein